MDIIEAISKSLYIRGEVLLYLRRLRKILMIAEKYVDPPYAKLDNEKQKSHIIQKYFINNTSGAMVCGNLDYEGMHSLLFEDIPIQNINLRELLTGIMKASTKCCHTIWTLMSSKTFNYEDVIYLKSQVNMDILKARMEYIMRRFGIGDAEVFNIEFLKDCKQITDTKSNYTDQEVPYPGLCISATQSINLADSMTIYLQHLFPRAYHTEWIYEWILKQQAHLLTREHIKIMPLSTREEAFLQKCIKDYKNSKQFNYFMYAASQDKKYLPWNTGFMCSRIHPNNIYLRVAEKLKRDVILGPSGTTEIMLNVAEIFNMPLDILTLALVPWMYIARDHSLFDIMIMANKFFPDGKKFTFKPADSFEDGIIRDKEQLTQKFKEVLYVSEQMTPEKEQELVNLYSRKQILEQQLSQSNNEQLKNELITINETINYIETPKRKIADIATIVPQIDNKRFIKDERTILKFIRKYNMKTVSKQAGGGEEDEDGQWPPEDPSLMDNLEKETIVMDQDEDTMYVSHLQEASF